jgi:hypothetical protein
MARRSKRFTKKPSELTKATESLNEATKDLETALKEIEVALDKLEELQKLRKQVAYQPPKPPLLPTPSRPEDPDLTLHPVPVYAPNTIVPVLISTFFRS